MDSVNSAEFNNRFTCHSESYFDNNIHSNGNRCKRMHGIDTGYGECKSASCSYRCTTACDLCGTAECNAYSQRSNNICMDSVNSAEFNNRFTGYSKSYFDNNIHSNGNRCKRMHVINTSDGE